VYEYAIKESPSVGDLVATLTILDRVVYIEEAVAAVKVRITAWP
jgi:hypothetical protein